MVIHVKFIAVTGKGVMDITDRTLIELYLYNHTKIQTLESESDNFGGHFVSILRTEARSASRAEFLAQYQAERLRSGGMKAKVFDTYDTAQDHLHETFLT